MKKIDLITGFLGSGKTTFIKKYVRHLLDRGEKICILINDFGAVNVDMMLLNELRSDNCELEMVSGGCDKDCHKRRFKTKLIAMGMDDYTRIIVEPSGIFDVDEFFDALYDEPICNWYKIENVISIVDSGISENNLSEASRYMLASEVASAGKIILSKTQNHTDSTIINTIKLIKNSLEEINCDREISIENPCTKCTNSNNNNPCTKCTNSNNNNSCAEINNFSDINQKFDINNSSIDNDSNNKNPIFIEKPWDQLTSEDLDIISKSGYQKSSYIKKHYDDDESFSSLYFLDKKFTVEKIKKISKVLFSDSSFGNVMRIKGFTFEEGKYYEVNVTKDNFSVNPISEGQDVLIIIGEKLDLENLKPLFETHDNMAFLSKGNEQPPQSSQALNH